MGSFYGQVLYEFKKLFAKINVTNGNSQTVSGQASTPQSSITPTHEWDELNCKSGNHWISLTSNTADNSITLSHSQPGNIVTNSVSISVEQEEPAQATIIPLEQGACIKTTKNNYDSAGHLASVDDIYYKLPISNAQIELNETNERVQNIEEHYLTIANTDNIEDLRSDGIFKGILISSYLDENKYIKEDTLNTAMGTYLQNNNYTTIALTGITTDMYDDSNPAHNPTIAETIGKVEGPDGYSLAVGQTFNIDQDATYTISDSIKLIVDEISTMRSQINNLSRLVDSLMPPPTD